MQREMNAILPTSFYAEWQKTVRKAEKMSCSIARAFEQLIESLAIEAPRIIALMGVFMEAQQQGEETGTVQGDDESEDENGQA